MASLSPLPPDKHHEHHDVEAQARCMLNLTAHAFLFYLLFLVPSSFQVIIHKHCLHVCAMHGESELHHDCDGSFCCMCLWCIVT